MSNVLSTKRIASVVRSNALARLALQFKCSPAKAEERMQRQSPKYRPYRVAFMEFVEDSLDSAFIGAEKHGTVISPAHWSAVIAPEKGFTIDPKVCPSGALVSYWQPGATA